MSVPFPSLLRDLCIVTVAQPLKDAHRRWGLFRGHLWQAAGGPSIVSSKQSRPGAPARRLCPEVEGTVHGTLGQRQGRHGCPGNGDRPPQHPRPFRTSHSHWSITEPGPHDDVHGSGHFRFCKPLPPSTKHLNIWIWNHKTFYLT